MPGCGRRRRGRTRVGAADTLRGAHRGRAARSDARRTRSGGAPKPVLLTSVSDDVRIAARVLERALSAVPELPRAGSDARELRVVHGGRAFRLDDAPPVDLATRPLLQRVLWALCEGTLGLPGGRRRAGSQQSAGISTNALVSRVWSGERVGARAAANRLYVALAELRRCGLGEVLRRCRGGYRLDAHVSVVTDRFDE